MKRERKSRIWQLITLCMVVFLAAFSLPIHAGAAPTDSPNPEYDDPSQWSTGERTLWNWMHNDLRAPMWEEFATLESMITNAGVDSAASTKTLTDIQTKVDSVDVAADLNNFYEEKEKKGSTEDMFTPIKDANSQVKGANKLWQMVGKVMEHGGDLSVLDSTTEPVKLGINISLFTNDYNTNMSNFMKLLAYSLVLLFFSVNLIETTVKYEIVSIKGAVVFGGRLLLGKLFIDLSTTVCVKVVNITSWVCGNLVASGKQIQDILAIQAKNPTNSNLWVIGKIVDFFNAITSSWLIVAIALVIAIISIAILIKLLIRNIQLTIFVIVAPPFFATLATETTKRYFHNYFTAFLQCALQVVFMCIVWYVGIILLNGHQIAGDKVADFLTDTSLYRTLIIFICMGILICKPPKFLTNALN